MPRTTGTSSSQPSHFIGAPDGARYEPDDLVPCDPDVAMAASAGNPVLTPTVQSGQIVVGVDGSEPSQRALARAVDLAEALNARLQIVTTWKHFTEYADLGVVAWSPEHDAREIQHDATERRFGNTPPEWVTTTVLEGKAAQRLIDASEGAEMLVVGSRGHGGMMGLLLGSVSLECAERAHCPVLVVH